MGEHANNSNNGSSGSGNEGSKDVAKDIKRKAKSLLIYPKFQIKLLLVSLVVVAMNFGLVTIQYFRLLEKLKSLGLQAGYAAEHPYFKFLGMQADLFWSYQIPAIVVGVLITTILMLRISHRVAGPILRLVSYFEQLYQTKNFEPLSFRKDDYFEELPDVINAALKNLTK